MRVVVDRELCEANAVCVRMAPEVFGIAADESLVVHEDQVTEAQRDAIERACDLCPRGALELVED